MSSLDPQATKLAAILQEALIQIPSEYKNNKFSHIPIVAKSLSNPQQKLEKLDSYIEILQDAVDSITNVHYRDFNQSIRNFSKTLEKVNASYDRVQNMVKSLDKCEELLQTHTEDLKSLYSSYRQYAECVRILTMVEEIRKVPKLLAQTIENKDYLQAAELIENSVQQLNKDELKGIKALSEIRNEIMSYRNKLPEILVRELNQFCYSTVGHKEISRKSKKVHTRNQSSFDDDISRLIGVDAPLQKRKSMEADDIHLASKETSDIDTIGVKGSTPDGVTSYTATDLKGKSESFIFIVIQALDVLKVLPDAQSSLIQDLKLNIRQLIDNHMLEFKSKFSESDEYWNLIHSSDTSLPNVLRAKKQVRPLRRLLKGLFEKLLAVISNFQFVIENVSKKLSSNQYDKSHYRPSIKARITKESLLKIKDSVQLKINSLMTDHLTRRTQSKSLSISILESFSANLELITIEGMVVNDLYSLLMNTAKSKMNTKMNTEAELQKIQDIFDSILSETFSSNCNLLTLPHIWNAIQMEVQSILVTLLKSRVNYYAKQTQESQPKQNMEIRFNFVNNVSTNAPSNKIMDGIIQDSNNVCAPLSEFFYFTPYNLIFIHKTLLGFLNTIEDLDHSCESGILISYIEMEVIPDTLIPNVISDYIGKLTETLEKSDAFQPHTSLKREDFMVGDLSSIQLRNELPSVPLMNSVLSLVEWMKDLISFSTSMPTHRDSFYGIIDQLLKTFYDMCKSKIESSLAGTYAMECMWTRQEAYVIMEHDPMWKKLTQSNYFKSKSYDDEEADFQSKLHSIIDIPLLEKKSFSKQLYITYSTDIILLANMSVSLEWLSEQIENIIQYKYESQKGMRDLFVGLKPKGIPNEAMEDMLEQLKTRRKKAAIYSSKIQEPNAPVRTSSKKISVLEKYVSKYVHLAHRILFALKIDLRTRCVVHTRPIIEGKYFLDEKNVEPDNYVQNLNKDLRRVEDCLLTFMPSTTIFYLLHLLSSLLSRIFIESLPQCKHRRFNENGVRKMQANIQALQQNLTNMTHTHRENEEFGEHKAFGRAHKFYEMLLLSPKEVCSIAESNSQLFSKKEYLYILETDTHLNAKLKQKAIESLMRNVN